MNVHLALVVGRASSEKISVTYGGLKCRTRPEFQRLGGLHIVMSVKKYGGFSGRAQRFPVYERMHFRRDNFDIFKPRAAQFPRPPLRSTLHIRLVFAFRADAGNP